MNGYIINYERYNFKGKLSDFPDTVEYCQKVQRLRRKLWNYLWKVNFLDRLEAEVRHDGESYWPYTVFENKENRKKAVVISNYREDPVEILVKLQGGGSRFDLYTPENGKIGKTEDGKVTISPCSAVVAVEP